MGERVYGVGGVLTPDPIAVTVECCAFLNWYFVATLLLLAALVVGANVGEWIWTKRNAAG